MSHTTLSMIEINPELPPIASIIWLHGLGADGNDFVPIVKELNLPKELPIRFVFPHAPLRPVTLNNGYVMRAWYDILSLQLDGKIDEAGIATAVTHVENLIHHEQQMGIATDKIILAGFSQGAVIALTAGLTYAKPLAGILALSGYFPHAEKTLTNKSIANEKIPIFLAHGTEDAVVPYFLGQHALGLLTREKYPVEWKSYRMGHTVCAEEIIDIKQWLKQQL